MAGRLALATGTPGGGPVRARPATGSSRGEGPGAIGTESGEGIDARQRARRAPDLDRSLTTLRFDARRGPQLGPRSVRALLRFAIARPRTVVAAGGLACAFSCLAIPRITVRLDGRSLIPAGQADIARADEAAERFALRDVVVVGITDPETAIKPDVLRWVTAFGAELARVPGVVPGSVTSLATLPRLFVEGDRIALEPLLGREGPVDVELSDRVARETAALGLADGMLVARDRRTTVILAEVAPEADRYRLLDAVRGLLARPVPAGAQVSLTGTALAQAVLGHACAMDLLRLLPAVIVIVAGALTLAFRHPVPAVVSLCEVGVSLFATAGLMGLAGEAIFVTTGCSRAGAARPNNPCFSCLGK